MKQHVYEKENDAQVPVTPVRGIENIEDLIQSESDNLPLDWMRVLLLDKLQKVTFSERRKDGTIGMAVKSSGYTNTPNNSDVMTSKKAASDNARPIPYASGDSIQRNQVSVFTKGKCAVIASTENIFGSPEPKPYPVPGSEVSQGRDFAYVKGRPDFRKEFALYCTGELQLNFLYLLWGKNLGTFFNKTLFDIVRYYRFFGHSIFKQAIKAILVTLNLNEDALPDKALNRDLEILAGMAASS